MFNPGDISELRAQFPILGESVYGRPLVYLDNAATSQRPQSVVDKWNYMTLHCNANLHRAVHKIAADATQEYESTRDAVRDFINAADRSEIVFTSGATASLNLVASCFGEQYIHQGDEIVIAESEHHSDIVPWQILAQRKGAEIRVLPVTDEGLLDIDRLATILESGRCRICCVAHVSNVLGLVNPIEEIVKLCHSKGCAVLVDGAQGIVHCPVDVQALGCDFYAFSGHKIYAAPGTGVLYAQRHYLDQMPPYMGGGEMIESVSFDGTTYAQPPMKYEAGTQNIAGTPTLKPALEMALSMRTPIVEVEQRSIVEYINSEFEGDPRIKVYGRGAAKVPLWSLTVQGAHHEDLALLLDKMGIAVRSGQMCAEPLMDRFGVTGMLRVSFAPYNTLEEAKYFVGSLRRAIKMLV